LAAGALRSVRGFSIQRQISHYRHLLANLAAELR
jgi:hypothetical protein